ncbi:MAG: protein jag [Clostridiales bacterium]|nr:protein jag [Clostridiales bacterium]
MAIFQGKTIEDAIKQGLLTLNIEREQAEIKVLEEPQKGFLGIGGKDAKVEVSKKESDGERAAEFLNGIFDLLKLPATTEVKENDSKIEIELITTNPTAIIGYRGEVLDALQTLASAAANIGNEEYKKVSLNCENYREKREETLKALALRVAEKAVKYGRKFALEPMNPFERKIIHSALTDNDKVKTESQGVEPNRYVVVVPENLKQGSEIEFYGKSSGKNHSNNKDRRNNNKTPRRDRNEKPEVIKLEKKTIGFGTFLGNSKNEN